MVGRKGACVAPVWGVARPFEMVARVPLLVPREPRRGPPIAQTATPCRRRSSPRLPHHVNPRNQHHSHNCMPQLAHRSMTAVPCKLVRSLNIQQFYVHGTSEVAGSASIQGRLLSGFRGWAAKVMRRATSSGYSPSTVTSCRHAASLDTSCVEPDDRERTGEKGLRWDCGCLTLISLQCREGVLLLFELIKKERWKAVPVRSDQGRR